MLIHDLSVHEIIEYEFFYNFKKDRSFIYILIMEEDNKKFILVPWDFTGMAENALMHAVKISRMVELPIVLLHIADKWKSAADLDKLRHNLEHVAYENATKFDVEMTSHVMEGNIFNGISEYANQNETSLVIMGTHGLRGMQKVTGSWALKVIVGSRVPFIVVQDKPTDWGKYKNLVFPVDFKSEIKEKLRWAIFMGKYFDSRVHILKQSVSGTSLLKKTNINLNYAIRLLIQNDIDYQIHELPKSGNFAGDILVYAQDMNSDLILIATTKNRGMASYMLGKSEQYIISNSSKIPVLVVNSQVGVDGVSNNQ